MYGEEGCVPAVDPDQQWGEWLRASPGRSWGTKEVTNRVPAGSATSFGSVRSSEGERHRKMTGTVRDLPTKRNLQNEFTTPTVSRTGEEGKGVFEDNGSPNK